jgi:hypothetical protein
MVEELLYPGIIGIACRWNAVFPSAILAQQIAAPVAVVEGWIGDDIIGFQVFVNIVEEGALVVPFNLRAVYASYSEVHFAQSPGGLIALLPVN